MENLSLLRFTCLWRIVVLRAIAVGPVSTSGERCVHHDTCRCNQVPPASRARVRSLQEAWPRDARGPRLFWEQNDACADFRRYFSDPPALLAVGGDFKSGLPSAGKFPGEFTGLPPGTLHSSGRVSAACRQQALMGPSWCRIPATRRRPAS